MLLKKCNYRYAQNSRIKKNAKDKLGDKFYIKAFHDVVLKSEALPLSVLQDRVNLWIEANK